MNVTNGALLAWLITASITGFSAGVFVAGLHLQAKYNSVPCEAEVKVVEPVPIAEPEVTYEEVEDPAYGIAIQRAKKFEGFSSTPYLLYGQWHIGFGHSIDDPVYYPSITREVAEELLRSDMSAVEEELVQSLSFYRHLPLEARMVLLDMGYNMGVPRLLGFTYMLEAARTGDWQQMAHEMIDSLYYDQVSQRASNNVMLVLDLIGSANVEGYQL